VAKAYHVIPLHPSQWPAAVVHALDNKFYIDTYTAFRATPSTGAEIFHYLLKTMYMGAYNLSEG
jgi:hypothetical protein